TWPARGRSPRVHEVETLTAAGQTVGLTASGLKLLSPSVEQPTAPVISSATITQLEFVVTTSASAAAVEWTLEGARQSPAPLKKTQTHLRNRDENADVRRHGTAQTDLAEPDLRNRRALPQSRRQTARPEQRSL